MRAGIRRLAALYGASPLHVFTMLACFALTAYTIGTLGVDALWDPSVWWQSILVWFLGAVVLHDFVLFPAYALADRLVRRGMGAAPRRTAAVPALNHVRIPALGSGLALLVFFPGILEQGGASYHRATGQTQDPFLARWLLLTAVIFGTSALIYGFRVVLARRGGRDAPDEEAADR